MEKFDYIDIHSHLNFPDYEKDFEEVVQRLRDTKTATITVGTDFASSKKAVELAEKYDMIYACIGLHPADNTTETFDEEKFTELVKHPKVVAIGECGLDYGRDKNLEDSPKEHEKARQKIDFEKQIDFAVKYDKPLMLHVRNAHEDTLAILVEKKKIHGEKLCGNSHFFSGDKNIAQQYLDLGFTVSFTGVLTFTHDYDEVVKYVPLDKMMSETDSPFVAPVPYRRMRNEPSYVSEVVKKIAEIRGEDFTAIQKALRDNAIRYFCL